MPCHGSRGGVLGGLALVADPTQRADADTADGVIGNARDLANESLREGAEPGIRGFCVLATWRSSPA